MLNGTRIAVTLGAFAVIGATASPALAQEQLVVAGFGGSVETTLRDKVIPKFEQEHNVTVVYVSGNSTDTLAKLQAQQGNQEIDVAFIDDLPMARAISLGLCAPITEVDFSTLQESAVHGGGQAVTYGTFGTGLVYNTEYFEQNGWDAPSSWNDLRDPKFQGKLVIPPISNGYGMLTLVMLARANGGSEENIDVAFDVMQSEVNQNVLAYEASPATFSQLLQTREAVIGVWGSTRVHALAETGFPVDFVYPEDGAPVMGSAICPVAKETVSPLAQAFIKAIVSEEVQEIVVADMGFAPVNKNVVVESPGMMPYGDNLAHAVDVNYDVINELWQGEWTSRWNREIER